MIDPKRFDGVGDATGVPGQNFSDRTVGCICKKQLFFALRPNSRRYFSRPINQFFTDDLLERCGISRDEMKRIRVFPPEVNFIVVSHLKTLRLI